MPQAWTKPLPRKGLQVISTDFVTRNNLLPGIGTDPQFATAAFGQTANAPADIVQLHDGFAVYQVTAVKPPSTPTFEEIRSQVEQQFKDERAASLLAQKTQELSDRAKADHDLKKAAKELGAEFKTSDFVAPDGQVPDIGPMSGPAAVAFSLKPGEISGPIDTATTGAVLSVTDRQAPYRRRFCRQERPNSRCVAAAEASRGFRPLPRRPTKQNGQIRQSENQSERVGRVDQGATRRRGVA